MVWTALLHGMPSDRPELEKTKLTTQWTALGNRENPLALKRYYQN